MKRRHLMILTACGAIVLSGCGRDQERRVRHLERDNQRLNQELTTAQIERRALQRERAWLEEQQAAVTQSNQPASTQATMVAGPDLDLPSMSAIDQDVEVAISQPAAGPFVLVLASVGPSHAQREYDQYLKVSKELNRSRPDGLAPLFGLRTPRKGGLQLVYGASEELGIGIDRKRCQQAMGVLEGRYRDAYILDTR